MIHPRDLIKQGDILLLVAGGSQLSAALLPCNRSWQASQPGEKCCWPPSSFTFPLLTLPASHPTAEPTLAPTLSSTFLIFGVPVVVGLILVLAAVCVFLACKEGKQRRKRKAADEEDKGRRPVPLPLPFTAP